MDLKEIQEQRKYRHPWETVRADFFCDVISLALDKNATYSVLDVGAGDTWFSTKLLEKYPNISQIVCWDINFTDDQLRAYSSIHPLLQCTRKLPQQKFDLVLLLDVLEHVKKDVDLLTAVVEGCLNESGYVLVSVPAWNILYSNHDRFLKHYRRYSPGDSLKLMRKAGLRIVRSGGLFHLLVLPRVIQRLFEKLFRIEPGSHTHAGNWDGGLIVTRALEILLFCETRASHLLQKGSFEIPGLSWWAVCRR